MEGKAKAKAGKKAGGLVAVGLLAAHTHQGRQYRENETVEVRPAQAEWLVKAGVAKLPREVT